MMMLPSLSLSLLLTIFISTKAEIHINLWEMGSNKGIVEKHLMKIIYDAWTIIMLPLLWLSRKRCYAFVKLRVFKYLAERS